MTSLFLALHRIAAQRGEGLRPELVRLLERRACPESDRARERRVDPRATLYAGPARAPDASGAAAVLSRHDRGPDSTGNRQGD